MAHFRTHGYHLVLSLYLSSPCHIIIIVNVQSNPHSEHHGPIQRERKLSVTLLIVTGVSLLTILPWAVYHSMPGHLWKQLPKAFHLLAVIYFGSSTVNHLVYAIRTQKFTEKSHSKPCLLQTATHQSESFTINRWIVKLRNEIITVHNKNNSTFL